jgi:chromate transporter
MSEPQETNRSFFDKEIVMTTNLEDKDVSVFKEKGHEMRTVHPSFFEAFKFWLKLGFINFGGPTGQIAIMHHELVEKRKWVSNQRFLNALNYCMLLPGPEAQQLAIYIGWLLHDIRGGVVAGAFFILPSVFILFILSYVYAAFGSVPVIASFFDGLKPAVMAIVAAAVIKIGSKALQSWAMYIVAALSFAAIFFLKAPFPVIILSAGLIGLAGIVLWPSQFNAIQNGKQGDPEKEYVLICEDPLACHINPSRKRDVMLILIFSMLWIVPVIILYAVSAFFLTEGLFFTKAAFLTFGGAYALLAYIAQAGVEQYDWLTTPQMMDGLGLAETTPGPLIMVVQFMGFMAGWNYPGISSPLTGGIIGSLIATYFTFLPSFLFILLGGPYVEKLRGNRLLSASLSSITAAVVGVILNLAVWFGLHVLFPHDAGFNWFGSLIGIASFVALQWGKIGVTGIILASGATGFARFFYLAA